MNTFTYHETRHPKLSIDNFCVNPLSMQIVMIFPSWVTGAGKFLFSAAVLTFGKFSLRLHIFKNYGDFFINRSMSDMISDLIS